jgi:hypothetical protein
MAEKQTNLWEDEHNDLIEDIKRGRLIPVLGGDINLCGRPRKANELYANWKSDKGISYPPTTSELAIYLLEKAIESTNSEGIALPTILLDLLKTKGEKNVDAFLPIGLVNVCQYLQFWKKDWLKNRLKEISRLNFEPTPVHEFLLQLAAIKPDPAVMDDDSFPYPLIVSACFDNVLEKLLDDRQQAYHLISFVLDKYGGGFEYTDPEKKATVKIVGDLDEATKKALEVHPLIIKLNGGLRSGPEEFAITEDHYIDYLTHNKLDTNFPPKLLARLKKVGAKDGPHLLFLGYSPRNWNLRVILWRIWSELMANTDKHWTFIQEKRKDLGDQDFWIRYAIKQFGLDEDDLSLVSMEDYVKALSTKLAQAFPVHASGEVASPDTVTPLPPSSNGSTGQTPQPAPQRDLIFFSYSHKDKDWLDRLKVYLAPVKGKLKTWDDQDNLQAGDKWRDEIENALASAKAAVLLVSPDFLASEFIQNNELPALLKAAEKAGCKLLWIYVRKSVLGFSDITNYQALYAGPPLASLEQHDDAMVKIVEDLLKVLGIN